MNPAVLLSLLPVMATPIEESAVAVEVEYVGQLSQIERGADAQNVNRFRVYCLIQPASEEGHRLDYLIAEQGPDGWSWPERLGHAEYGPGHQRRDGTAIRLLHRFQNSDYPIEIPCPLFDQFARMKDSGEWQVDQRTYTRGKRTVEKERSLREIEIFSRIGRSHELRVDEQTGLVHKVIQKVFMGRGDEFRLELQLTASRSIDESQLKRRNLVVDSLRKLQASLGRREGRTRADLSPQQLSAVQEQLPDLETAARSTPFQTFVATISRDTANQSQREKSVDQLAQRFLGKPAPEFALTNVRFQPVDPEEYRGKITVLHFWDYQFEPLEEPYGQVGYLDYLQSRRSKLGVKFYGVAVSSLLGQQETSRAAVRSVRKLREFMNLGYEVTIDPGPLLRKFGDPRRLNAELPLWVVLDDQGNVAFYKSGVFQLKPDEGLKELDQVLIQLIRAERRRKSEASGDSPD